MTTLITPVEETYGIPSVAGYIKNSGKEYRKQVEALIRVCCFFSRMASKRQLEDTELKR